MISRNNISKKIASILLLQNLNYSIGWHKSWMACCFLVGHVLLVTRWLIFSSAYKSWQSIMVSHRAVDQFNSWESSINMSPPDQHVDLDIWQRKNIFSFVFPGQISISICWSGELMLIDNSQLLNWSTVLWDTIIDCQDLYAKQKINHLVTRRTWPSVYDYLLYKELESYSERRHIFSKRQLLWYITSWRLCWHATLESQSRSHKAKNRDILHKVKYNTMDVYIFSMTLKHSQWHMAACESFPVKSLFSSADSCVLKGYHVMVKNETMHSPERS